MKLRRAALLIPLLPLLLTAACAERANVPSRYFQPTAAQIGPEPNSYGEAVLPDHGLIAVQGDDLAYGVARRPTRNRINEADQGQAATTISQGLRQALGARRVTVENRGFPGDTVAASAQRWAGAPRPDLLILAFGFGDMQAHTQVGPFAEGLRKLIHDARAQGTAVFIVTPPGVSDKLTNANLAPYLSVAANVAAEQDVELFAASTSMATAKEAPSKGIPQSARTYAVIAGSMVPYIKLVRPAG
jgi:hypothetical protein